MRLSRVELSTAMQLKTIIEFINWKLESKTMVHCDEFNYLNSLNAQ